MYQIVKFKPLKKRKGKIIGILVVKYYELEMHCQLRVTSNYADLWLKMPTKKLGREKEMNILNWPSKEISDRFQNEVKRLIREQLPELYMDKLLTEKQNQDMSKNFVGRARSHSRFTASTKR